MSSVRVRTRADKSTYTQILYRHNEKQTSQSFEDHATALRWKKLLDQVGPDEALRVLEAQIGAAANSVPLLGDWLPTYIGLLTAAEDGTIDRYRAMVRNDFGEDLLQLPLSALTETHVANWVNSQKAAGSSGKTIANKHGFLAGAMKAAVDKRLVTANPCANTKLPKWDPPVMTFLKSDEFRAILDEMPKRWRGLTLFLVTSGCRFSEATALNIADIDSREQTCRIDKAWKDTRAKGGERWKIGHPKTRKSIRTINLAPEVFEYLDLSRGAREFLFLNTRGKAVGTGSYYHNVWKPAVERAGAALHGKSPRVHDLRHTCASWMIAARVPLPVIQDHLGHESITTTIHTYGHLDRSAHVNAASAISNALAGVDPAPSTPPPAPLGLAAGMPIPAPAPTGRSVLRLVR
ncbi:tyrosine-type recombinase/integrase [Nocardia niigatensis]